MNFECNDTTLYICRDSYHFHNPEERDNPISGNWILELYYYFDAPGIGWGSVGSEFVYWKDIPEWLQGMEKVEQGKTDRFEKYFYQDNAEKYFLKLTLETVDDQLRLQLSISDGLTDDYIEIDQLFSKEEWKTYSDEFRLWNQIYPYQLGDHVRTVKDINEYVKADKVGIVSEIYVSDDDIGQVSYGVVYQAESWRGLYWDGFACKSDDIELLKKTNS